jgi:site-specific DNA-adenine methylase
MPITDTLIPDPVLDSRTEADAIAAGHDRLAEIAQECSTRAGASTYRGTGSKPVTQEVLRWDQEA